MARKNLLGFIIAFALALVAVAGIIQAQSPTPTTKGGVTPTPTKMPRAAPPTGFGGGR